jgi:sugar/nucleoside kinase (ribokinase family)
MEINNKDQVDVLCIGDTVVEPFIKLINAEVHCNIDKVGCTITMPFGAKVPFESSTMCYGVGNAANAAVSLGRLGLKSAIATELGDDDYGRKSIENFHNNHVDTTPTNLHKDIPTNYHYVLWYPPERTILIQHNSYPRHVAEEKFSPNGVPPKFIYFSGLPADSMNYHSELAAWLKKHSNTKLVFQPGTFQIKSGVEALKDFYTHSYIYILNKEEAQEVLHSTENSLQVLLEKVQKLGPEIVCITDGPNGAYMRAKDESDIYKNYFMPIYPDIAPPLERTGCGDAFASAFTAAIVMGKTPLQALEMAPINSMNVVQHIGAQAGLLTLAEIETYLKNKPESYKVVEI